MTDANVKWANRIIRTGEASVEEVLENPFNWRVHSEYQKSAIKKLIQDVGWVQFVIINETTGHLIDGHARLRVAVEEGEETIPAVWVKLTEKEERLVLASLDATAGMAEVDEVAYIELAKEIQADFNKSYGVFLGGLSNDAFSLDLQPTFETSDFDGLLEEARKEAELAKEAEAAGDGIHDDLPESFYHPNVELVTFKLAMSPDEKNIVMGVLMAVAEKRELSVVEALVEVCQAYETYLV